MDVEKLEKLNELKEKGIITQEEFDIQKKIILNKDDDIIPNKPTPMNADKSVWGYFVECLTKKYCSFKGRARRKEFFGYMLFRIIFGSLSGAVLGGFLGGILGYHMGLEGGYIGGDIAGYIVYLFFLLPDLGVWVRRLHDAGYSAWWITLPWLIIIPVAAVGAIVEYATAGMPATDIIKVFKIIKTIIFVFAPFVSMLIPTIFIFFKSEEKENKYGPVPEGVLK